MLYCHIFYAAVKVQMNVLQHIFISVTAVNQPCMALQNYVLFLHELPDTLFTVYKSTVDSVSMTS